MLLPRSLLRTHATAAARVARKPSQFFRALHTSPALRAIDMAKVDTTERLAELRKLMKERNVDIYSTQPCSSTAETSLTYVQWYHLKTATRASTLLLATPAEVRFSAVSLSTPIDFPQHTLAVSPVRLDTQSSHTTRPLYRRTDDISTRPRSSWTATGSCSSRASRMYRLFKNGP